jgi:aldehyde dehydrogenase family 7 protein A1
MLRRCLHSIQPAVRLGQRPSSLPACAVSPSFRFFSSSSSSAEFGKHGAWLQQLGIQQDANSGVYFGASSGFGGKGPLLESVNPSTNEVIATVQSATDADYEACIAEMDSAKAVWANTPAPVRGEVVRKIGEALRKHKKALGNLISLEMGKIEAEGLGEVQEAIDICDYAVGLSRMLPGKVIPSERQDHFMMERFHPLQGHVGIITAFNFPCAVLFWNLAISLVCGNTNIWKGSESASLVTIACSQIVNEVLAQDPSVPTGVFTSLLGDPGRAIVDDKRVELVSFTGSTQVGRQVNERVASRFGKTILELGGNNAMVVLDDADLDLAIRGALFSAVGTCGQRCTSLRRIYVQGGVYDEFLARLLKSYEHIPIGDPLDAATLCGPLNSKAAVEQYTAAIADIQAQGGQILCGGEVMQESSGNFVKPTVVSIASDAAIVQTELFMPIVYVMKIDDLAEGIQRNNDVPQGLSSSLFTTNQAAVFQWTGANGSDCGIVNINIGPSGAEIGGAFGGEKETGGGRESGSDAWMGYTRRTTCTINYSKDLPLAQGVNFDV